MKCSILLSVIVAAALVASGTSSAVQPGGATAATASTPIDLGTLGGRNSHADAMNDHGQVVGDSLTAGGVEHAFSWTQKGGMVDLETLGEVESHLAGVNAVNERGQVVGDRHPDPQDGNYRAFLWSQKDGMVDLGGSLSVAYAVNDRGQVVGNGFFTASEGEQAFSWTQKGGVVDLGTFGGSYSVAYAVNDRGQVVGSADTAGAMCRMPSPGRCRVAWSISARSK